MSKATSISQYFKDSQAPSAKRRCLETECSHSNDFSADKERVRKLSMDMDRYSSSGRSRAHGTDGDQSSSSSLAGKQAAKFSVE